MKLLLTVVALAALAHGAPTTTHSMEIGAHGVSGNIQNNPLVEIIINKISSAAPAPETVNEAVIEPEPVLVVDEAQNPESVLVIDEIQNPESVIVVDQLPNPVVVVDRPEVSPIEVIPAPAPVEVGQPEVNPVDIIAVNPEPAPVVIEQPEANPIDIIQVNPIPEPIVLPGPSPAEVVPEPVVVPEPTPVEVAAPSEVIEVPVPEATETAEGSQIINVMMNFIFGAGGSLSSVEVPASVIPQVVGAPRV